MTNFFDEFFLRIFWQILFLKKTNPIPNMKLEKYVYSNAAGSAVVWSKEVQIVYRLFLVYRIDVHACLLILRKKSPLHGLIWVCTFIVFLRIFPPARLFRTVRLFGTLEYYGLLIYSIFYSF